MNKGHFQLRKEMSLRPMKVQFPRSQMSLALSFGLKK